MLIAGEPSGDLLGAELVAALRRRLADAGAPEPRFIGAGGPQMAAEKVELALDLTRFAIIGLADVLRNIVRLRRILQQLLALALQERPDVIVCIDYGGFNRRFAAALRARQPDDWHPKLVQYVSPQVWASRPDRARTLARDLDLLISILPFESAWYAARYPRLRVEFVGHPIIDRHAAADAPRAPAIDAGPRIVLLPGSRPGEIARHWPVMAAAARMLPDGAVGRWVAVFANEDLCRAARRLDPGADLALECRIGGLGEELSSATLAIAATGTVTLECALWNVPTIAIYRASWSTYQIARRIIRVRYLAMPNLLADERVMPELLQGEANPGAIAAEIRRLLESPEERERIRRRLRRVIEQLGSPGGAERAATAVLSLVAPPPAGLAGS